MVTSADGSGCLLEAGIGVGLGLGVGTIVDVGEKEAVGVGDEELAFEFPCPPPQADNNNVADKMAALAFFMKKISSSRMCLLFVFYHIYSERISTVFLFTICMVNGQETQSKKDSNYL